FAKAMLLAAADGVQRAWLWPPLLIAGLCALVALSRAGSTLFWRSQESDNTDDQLSGWHWAGTAWLLIASPLLVVLAGPLATYTEAAAAQLNDPSAIIQALLPTEEDAP